MHFTYIKQIFIGYHLSIYMLNILLEYLWWWEVEKATNCLYLVTGFVLAELHHRKQKSGLMLGIDKWMGSTEYAYEHLAAHTETPKFSWFNLLMYATSIIWQNICTEQLACLSSRLRQNFEIQCTPGSQKDTVCLPGRLSASQHAAVPSLLEWSKKSCLLFIFLLVWASTAILKATASVLFCIKKNLSFYSLICVFEVIKSRIRSCTHISGMKQHFFVWGKWVVLVTKYKYTTHSYHHV